MSPENDPLFQPYQLKHLKLRNRLMSTSHEPNFGVNGMPAERYRLYHVEKAKGGIALTMTAGSALVSQDSPAAFGNLHAYKDEIIPYLKDMADECHEHGSAVMIQITHLGRRTGWNHGDWLPVVAPSSVREPAHRTFPKVIEHWDIDRIVADYGAAAQRMQAAGLDGVEIEAHGHLLDSFWSPSTNQRDDEYGGSIENRLRMTVQVLQSIRDHVGPDFIVGVRMVADEAWNKGFDAETGKEIARLLIATGNVDFLNILRGHIETDAALTRVIPVQGMASAPHLDFSGEIRAATKFPVFHAAKIDDVATARHAIASGKLDMVGMTRAHIADPYIAAKTMAGRETEIRPCVGATYCLDRIYEGRGAACIHNAATGREANMPQVIVKTDGLKKRITIVGAGPAGLEAARVSAARGHAVIVFEANSQAGGQINLITRLERRSSMAGIVDWRMSECTRDGVEFRFNTYAEAYDILETKPDIVVLATGGLPNTEILESGNELVVSTWDILSGDVKPGETVILYDDNGAHPGMQTAEMIARAGSDLEIITPERFFAPEIGGLNHVQYAESFHEFGVHITINTRVQSIARDGNKLKAQLTSDYGDVRNGERIVDQVIVEHGTLPLDDIYFELKDRSINQGAVDYRTLTKGGPQEVISNPDGKFQLYRIGDAVSSRNIHAAIYDGLRFCKDF